MNLNFTHYTCSLSIYPTWNIYIYIHRLTNQKRTSNKFGFFNHETTVQKNIFALSATYMKQFPSVN